MNIVFCITCRGRVQHVKEALPKNLEDNGLDAYSPKGLTKFVLVDYNSNDGLQEYLQAKHSLAIAAGYLTVYHFPAATTFKVAHAKNMAHRCGILEGGDILVNLDADNFTGPNFSTYIREQFEAATKESFMWARMIQSGPDRLPRGINGRIIVTKNAFLNVGGYDERYAVWSPDDKDFNLRLRRLKYNPIEIDRKYLSAITHTDKMRFKEYKHVSTHLGCESLETIHDADTTVVNYGNFGCGRVFRNYSDEPIDLNPLPTRIFGIGMHKTGTTSLHQALKILGYDSAHWKSAHWAKAIWEEMSTFGRSETLERNYALSDLPIPLLYSTLDKTYPNSKFILTTRNEDSWLNSVRNHWSHEKNRFRADWSTDPFTHRVHKLLYGQKGFDEAIFRERFRRHEKEAQEYFYGQGRYNDLLVLDLDKGHGWPQLCQFLGQKEPNVPYPKAFPTKG